MNIVSVPFSQLSCRHIDESSNKVPINTTSTEQKVYYRLSTLYRLLRSARSDIALNDDISEQLTQLVNDVRNTMCTLSNRIRCDVRSRIAESINNYTAKANNLFELYCILKLYHNYIASLHNQTS